MRNAVNLVGWVGDSASDCLALYDFPANGGSLPDSLCQIFITIVIIIYIYIYFWGGGHILSMGGVSDLCSSLFSQNRAVLLAFRLLHYCDRICDDLFP